MQPAEKKGGWIYTELLGRPKRKSRVDMRWRVWAIVPTYIYDRCSGFRAIYAGAASSVSYSILENSIQLLKVLWLTTFGAV